MIEAITTDYNIGLGILERIQEQKIVKHSEKISHIYGFHEVIFMYSNEESQAKHEADMLLRGWSKIEAQNYISIYSNSLKKICLKAPCSIYKKDISSISLISGKL